MPCGVPCNILWTPCQTAKASQEVSVTKPACTDFDYFISFTTIEEKYVQELDFCPFLIRNFGHQMVLKRFCSAKHFDVALIRW